MSPKANSSESFRVGYALPPNKVQTSITPSLISHAIDRGVELIQVDLEKPLNDQGPFDCLIHKIRTPEWNTQLLDFKSNHPDTVIVDHPDSIEPLKNRVSMLEVVPRLGINSLGAPIQVYLSGDHEVISMPDLIEPPLIAKPLSSDGSLSSHEMCLVLNAQGLRSVVSSNLPVVLQQFVNHGGVLFKVYVAGKHVKCVKRKSVPDITPDNNCDVNGDGILPFSHISNVTEEQEGGEALLFGVNVAHLVEQAEMPEMSYVTEVAQGLRKALGLNLFNFDMIRNSSHTDATHDRYLLIDINYFPGFAKVPGFELMLTDFLFDVCSHNY